MCGREILQEAGCNDLFILVEVKKSKQRKPILACVARSRRCTEEGEAMRGMDGGDFIPF